MRWVIRESKYYWWEQISLIKVNVRANIKQKKITQPFGNNFLNEPLLNTPFNNGSRHKIIVKDDV
jgi:hypothetical protein